MSQIISLLPIISKVNKVVHEKTTKYQLVSEITIQQTYFYHCSMIKF